MRVLLEKAAKTNYITIYTDASFCVDTKIGGWGCWIKYHPECVPFMRGRPFTKPIGDSIEAEMKAIVNALKLLSNRVLAGQIIIPENTVIVLVTDSQCAIDIFYRGIPASKMICSKNAKKKKSKIYYRRQRAKLHNQLRQMIIDGVPAGCELRLKKVKAHSSADGKRSYVNGLVDKMARGAMKGKRKEEGLCLKTA